MIPSKSNAAETPLQKYAMRAQNQAIMMAETPSPILTVVSISYVAPLLSQGIGDVVENLYKRIR